MKIFKKYDFCVNYFIAMGTNITVKTPSFRRTRDMFTLYTPAVNLLLPFTNSWYASSSIGTPNIPYKAANRMTHFISVRAVNNLKLTYK